MKKSLIFLIILFLTITVDVKADNNSISLICAKNTLSKNESTSCTISGNSSFEVSAVHTEIVVGQNLTISGISKDASWEGNNYTNNKIDIYTDSNKTNSFAIATFNVTASEVTEDLNTYVEIKNTIYTNGSTWDEESIVSSKYNIIVKSDVKPPTENNNNTNNTTNNNNTNSNTNNTTNNTNSNTNNTTNNNNTNSNTNNTTNNNNTNSNTNNTTNNNNTNSNTNNTTNNNISSNSSQDINKIEDNIPNNTQATTDKTNNKIKNPQTYVGVSSLILLAIISISGIIYVVVNKKKVL